MKQFSDFAVEAKRSFIGPSVIIEDILEQEIIVEYFSIGPSIKTPGTECLTLQIKHNGADKVIFTGSTFLMRPLKNLNDDDFPFQTKIIKVNRHWEFR